MRTFRPFLTIAVIAASSPSAKAQDAPAKKERPQPPPEVRSPEVGDDRKVTFRLLAPNAKSVRLAGNDMPAMGRGIDMTKGESGIWEAALGPVDPGAYRYLFIIDGVTVADSRNTSTSESNSNLWSLVYVPGSEISDLKDVPHGAVSEVNYYSTTLKRFRRMHVYTPPGYESGAGKFPVFYLLHGASDCDDSWSTVGRAGLILDNLIAAKKAKPMVVVMPAGHTGAFSFGGRGGNSFQRQMSEFVADFTTDLKPFVEKRYRLKEGRANRAIAGLSMGGAQTIDIAMANLSDYAYVGVYSSGVFGITGGGPGGAPAQGPTWEERNQKTLDDPELKKGLQLVWFATGKDDFLLNTTKATVAAFKKHDFSVIYEETAGGHTWINWRNYLNDFAPLLFVEPSADASKADASR